VDVNTRYEDEHGVADDAGDPIEDVTEIDSIDYYGARVDAMQYSRVYELIKSWARCGEGRTVALAGVPTIILSCDEPRFREAYEEADLVLADGMPMVWALRHAGFPRTKRLCGPDLIQWLCEDAARDGIPVGFYGSTRDTLQDICTNLTRRYPDLDVRYIYSAPFRPLSDEEEQRAVADANRAGVGILFVSLSFPEHAYWLSRQRDRARFVMVAVGGAFAVAAGRQGVPPRWVQNAGWQWAYRLVQEPRRLWKRYLMHNTRYLLLVLTHPFQRAAVPRSRGLTAVGRRRA